MNPPVEPPDRGRGQKADNLWEEFPALNGSNEETSKPPGAASVAPATGAAQAAPTYSESLKSNVKFDQRLKRNVLEICLEKAERDTEIILNGDTIARVLRSLKMSIETELEGVQVQYGRVPMIHAWCKPHVNLEKFCTEVNIKISNGLSTGHIRPAGRRDVLLTIQGLNFNTPDGLVQEYITKFGGKLMDQNVIYKEYREGILVGKYTGDRQYRVIFEEDARKMGTFHFLDGARVKIFYRGNTTTCGRCHKSREGCKGEGIAKVCMEKGGERVSLFEHMKTVWSHIGFKPTTFELPEEEEDAGGKKEGDRLITKPAKKISNDPNLAQIGENISGIKINNFPPEISEAEVLKFVKTEIKSDLEIVNFTIHPAKSGTRKGTKVEIFSGLNKESIEAAIARIDKNATGKNSSFGRPLYCTTIKCITPEKYPEGNSNTEEEQQVKTKTRRKKYLDSHQTPGRRLLEKSETEPKTPDQIIRSMTDHVLIDFPEISPHHTPVTELKPKNINDELTEALESSENSVENIIKSFDWNETHEEVKDDESDEGSESRKNKKCQNESPADLRESVKSAKISNIPVKNKTKSK